MYNITFDASGLLLNLTDVNEGENQAHGFSVYNLVSGLDYIWPLYKLPSGKTVAGAKVTLESANYTNNSFHVDFPNCLLTEFGRVLVQIVATNSTADSIDEIFDAYAAGTFTGKIVKSRLYDFYANESIDALMEMASASGGISQAVKDYLDNLGAICYRRILPSDSGIDGKISNVLENAVFYCNSTDRVFTDPPTNDAYTLINTQRSRNYNLQLAFGTSAEAPYIFWRIVNRNRNAADHDAAWITISGGGGDVATKMDKVNPTGSGAISVGRKSGTTVGANSVALGNDAVASGIASVAEGDACVASGGGSHAEGIFTSASGSASHSEGQETGASGVAAHAEGTFTRAASANQHVQGKYNEPDQNGRYAHILGNGTGPTNQSNAHTIDWSGNAWFAGDVRVGGSDYDSGTLLPTDFVVTGDFLDFTSFSNADKNAMQIFNAYQAGKHIVGRFNFGIPFMGTAPFEMRLILSLASAGDPPDDPPVYTYIARFAGVSPIPEYSTDSKHKYIVLTMLYSEGAVQYEVAKYSLPETGQYVPNAEDQADGVVPVTEDGEWTTIDITDTVQSGDTNLITSGGVYTAIQNAIGNAIGGSY